MPRQAGDKWDEPTFLEKLESSLNGKRPGLAFAQRLLDDVKERGTPREPNWGTGDTAPVSGKYEIAGKSTTVWWLYGGDRVNPPGPPRFEFRFDEVIETLGTGAQSDERLNRATRRLARILVWQDQILDSSDKRSYSQLPLTELSSGDDAADFVLDAINWLIV